MTLSILTLRDAATGSVANILPDFGFNCFRFQAMAEGPVEILWSEPGFETGSRRASGSGIPILFPFPGRIAGTSLEYGGRRFPLAAGDGRGNAIHGFVLDRPWRVLEQSDSLAVGQFHAAVDEPHLSGNWPGDFRITVTYRLAGNELSLSALLENPGETDLPMGFGVHPYFRLPLGGDNATAVHRDSCRIRIPAREYWESQDMLATGRTLPADIRGDLIGGIAFGETSFDDVFTSLVFEEGWATATIADPATGREVRVAMDRAFRECVVYNPPHREAICIEPYTCVPNAIALAERDIDGGLKVLRPHESLTAKVKISLV